MITVSEFFGIILPVLFIIWQSFAHINYVWLILNNILNINFPIIFVLDTPYKPQFKWVFDYLIYVGWSCSKYNYKYGNFGPDIRRCFVNNLSALKQIYHYTLFAITFYRWYLLCVWNVWSFLGNTIKCCCILKSIS